MEPVQESKIIRAFVKELVALQLIKSRLLPDWINLGFDWIDQANGRLKERRAKWYEYLELMRYRRELEKLTRLDCFGFNSASFDIPAIAGPLFFHLKQICTGLTFSPD